MKLLQLFVFIVVVSSGLMHAQKDSSDFISLKRSGCYGPCPIYSITIYSDGTVNYSGEKYVEVRGTYSYKIPADSAEYLFRKADKISFFSLKDEYREGKFLEKNKDGSYDTLRFLISDLPTQIVTIKRSDKKKSVVDYFKISPSHKHYNELKKYEAPQALKDFEKEIDRVAAVKKFVIIK